MLRVGFISYLNAYPFYYPFQNMSSEETQGWQLIVDRPGILNKKIHDGELDVSLVSFMEYAKNPEKYLLVPGVGLSSKGYVDSVRLLSQKPLNELHGSEIRITSASATSVAVMEILLREEAVSEYSLKPYEVQLGIPTCTAALTIGDEALTQKQNFKYSYDLGEIWQQKFSKNIVFASCVINRQTTEWKAVELSSFVKALQGAPAVSYSDKEKFEKACLEQYPQIKDPIDYLDRLQFSMGEPELADMHFFLEKAFEYKLLGQQVQPEYYQPLLDLAEKGE
jgi:chorismate dehydratase